MYDQYGFNSIGLNKDGFDIYGFDKDGLNKDGYKKKSGKGLNINTLPILLSKLYTNNSSKELTNNIKNLLNHLHDTKQITKQVYNNFIKAIKMTRKEHVKILDDKIKANDAQYELDRLNAEISAYSSGDLPKCEYLTKKDLDTSQMHSKK